MATACEFSKELNAFIDEWKMKPGNLIMILHRVQEEQGFISREAATEVANRTGNPLARVYGTMSFYSFFKTVKPGRNKISVCLGTACYLKGGQALLEEARSILNIEGDEVTDDGLYSIDAVRCVGCCGLAPVLMVGDEVYGKVTPEQLPEIIAKHRN